MSRLDCNIEIEKKFLIQYPDIQKLEKYNLYKYEIEQIYLLSDFGSHRIRKRALNGKIEYFENKKIRISGSKCYEFESKISEDEYSLLRKNADSSKKPILKDRYCITYGGKLLEIDVFPFWKDKALLEIELDFDEEKFSIPEEITVIKDVSDDIRYKNNYLAGIKYENC